VLQQQQQQQETASGGAAGECRAVMEAGRQGGIAA
jgi:hypothetical protein